VRRALALIALLLPAVVHADAEELTLALEAGGGLLRVGDYSERGASTQAPAGRAGLRAGYGLSDTLQIELAAAAVLAPHAEFPNQQLPPPNSIRATQEHAELAVRGTTGIALRFGAQFVPTLRLFGGFQQRFLYGADFYDPASGSAFQKLPGKSQSDVLVGAALGFEVRLSAHWLLGLSVELVHAFPLAGGAYDAVEVPMALTYATYPRWFSGSGFVSGGEPLVE
jgi:hypothetical protein